MLPEKHLGIQKLWILIPVFGILAYAVLYYLASLLYPGGSNADVSSEGFNWVTNYWCDLLGTGAKNGQLNPARPLAMVAMIILCLSLSIFWYYLPRLFKNLKIATKTIQIAGISSMILAVFIFTSYHDFVIYAAGALGLIAVIGAVVGLFKSHALKLFWGGFFCLILIVVNNYIYRSGHFIEALPLIQKISFFIYFLWIALLDIEIFKKENANIKRNME